MLPYWARVEHSEDHWLHPHTWIDESSTVHWVVQAIFGTRTTVSYRDTIGGILSEEIDRRGWMTVVGLAMVGLSIGMMIPGPIDAIAFTIGFGLGGLWGGVAAVLAYNLLAVLVFLVGSALIYFD